MLCLKLAPSLILSIIGQQRPLPAWHSSLFSYLCFMLFVFRFVRSLLSISVLLFTYSGIRAQENHSTAVQVNQLIEKKAEYHKLSDGAQDGYRIKIHFGVDKDKAVATRTKFSTSFEKYLSYLEYEQPNFVVLVGDFKTKLEAFEALKKIQFEFPNSFIVKGRINVK